jgi:hypothetical protein
MALTIPKANNYALAPAGTHNFVCYQVLDLGTQVNQTYNNKSRQIALFFELIGTDVGDGRPFTMTRKFSYTWGAKSSLKAFLTSWLPQEKFDDSWSLDKLIGQVGMLLVTHDKSQDGSKTYANLKSVMPLPAGMKLDFKMSNMPRSLFLDDSFKIEQFNELPEYWQKIIGDSPEFDIAYKKQIHGDRKPESKEGVEGDQIPF